MRKLNISLDLQNRAIFLLCFLAFGIGCNQQNASTPTYVVEQKNVGNEAAITERVVDNQVAAGVPPVKDGLTSASKACRAVIASLNGRSFNTILDDGAFEGNQSVRYTRESDGKAFRYACRFRGNSAMWAMIDERGAGTGIGAWAGDGSGLRTIKVTESAAKIAVEVTWQDGTRENYTF